VSVQIVDTDNKEVGQVLVPVQPCMETTVREVMADVLKRAACFVGVRGIRSLSVMGGSGGMLFPEDEFFSMWDDEDVLVATCTFQKVKEERGRSRSRRR